MNKLGSKPILSITSIRFLTTIKVGYKNIIKQNSKIYYLK